MDKFMEKVKSHVSKKLVSVLGLGITIVANQKLGLGIPENQILGFSSAVVAYVLGQSHVDAKKMSSKE